MATITDDDLKMFQERAKTEFASRCDTGGIAWDSVIWDLCNEVRRLRSVSTERGDCAKLREALVTIQNCDIAKEEDCITLYRVCEAALAAPARNCDKYPTFNDAIRVLADKRGWHDAKWNSERYCILAQWLYAPYEEGGNDGNE